MNKNLLKELSGCCWDRSKEIYELYPVSSTEGDCPVFLTGVEFLDVLGANDVVMCDKEVVYAGGHIMDVTAFSVGEYDLGFCLIGDTVSFLDGTSAVQINGPYQHYRDVDREECGPLRFAGYAGDILFHSMLDALLGREKRVAVAKEDLQGAVFFSEGCEFPSVYKVNEYDYYYVFEK